MELPGPSVQRPARTRWSDRALLIASVVFAVHFAIVAILAAQHLPDVKDDKQARLASWRAFAYMSDVHLDATEVSPTCSAEALRERDAQGNSTTTAAAAGAGAMASERQPPSASEILLSLT
eukprot:tig00000430_g632.t1